MKYYSPFVDIWGEEDVDEGVEGGIEEDVVVGVTGFWKQKQVSKQWNFIHSALNKKHLNFFWLLLTIRRPLWHQAGVL